MKRSVYTLSLTVALLLSTYVSQAQAWSKDSKVLALGLGASHFFHVYPGGLYRPGYIGYRYSAFDGAFVTGQLNFQGEFGVHDYVGVGFTTGVGGGAGLGWSYGYPEVNVPIGVIANFHFFQLIADKTSKDIHSDKLDVYAGLNVGSGIAAQFWSSGTRIIPIAFGGFQVGLRYYFTDKLGVNAELGYGKSLVNGGIVFKL